MGSCQFQALQKDAHTTLFKASPHASRSVGFKFTLFSQKLFHITKIKRELRKMKKKIVLKSIFESSLPCGFEIYKHNDHVQVHRQKNEMKRKETNAFVLFIHPTSKMKLSTIFLYFLQSHPSCFGFTTHFTMLSRSFDLQQRQKVLVSRTYNKRMP